MEPLIDFQIIYDFLLNIDQHFLLCVSFITVVLSTILVISYWEYSWGGQISANGKTVFITGCDSGFGLALAQRLDSLNIHVIAACLSLNSDGAKKLVNIGNNDVIKCDITLDDDVTKARQFVERHLERSGNDLWGIVNNAGIGCFNFFELTPLETFKKIYEVNALGQVRVIKALVPFVRRCSGRIVNVASQAGRFCMPGMSSYCMSKFAVVAMSNTLRMELAQFGVKVSIIQPSLYRTSIMSTAAIDEVSKREWIATSDEIKRDYGEEYFQKVLINNRKKAEIDAREDIYEVVDCMIHALVAQRPKHFYDCHWTTTLIRRVVVYILPEFLLDLLFITRQTPGLAASVRRE